MRPMGCYGAGLTGQAVEWEIGVCSTYFRSHSYGFTLSVGAISQGG